MDDTPPAITIRVVDALAGVDPAAWNAAARAADGGALNPFMSWEFLEALEATRCVAPITGWAPRHLIAEDASGAVVGVVPAYLKGHSQGEFVFDHAWADAYERASGRYYPKLQVCAPFTPATGPRLLAGDPAVRGALLSGLIQITEELGLSSLHVTFPTRAEWKAAGAAGLLQRTDQQFHWFNNDYATYEDFLAALSSRKRKALRKERAAAQDGVEIVRLSGGALTPEHWDAFYEFYQDTGARKWGSPYLNRETFALLHERMADQIVMVMARADGRWIAGALNFLGETALYGRYWGCVETRPFLHFEVCYHQAIDEAIARGLARVEAGAQGGHKIARGYEPVPVYSYHHLVDGGFRAAVEEYLERERAAVAEDIDHLSGLTPFKKSD